jgi:hypothetical protein
MTWYEIFGTIKTTLIIKELNYRECMRESCMQATCTHAWRINVLLANHACYISYDRMSGSKSIRSACMHCHAYHDSYVRYCHYYYIMHVP